MNVFTSTLRHRTVTAAGALVLAATFGLTACSTPAEPAPAASQETAAQESNITLDNAWGKAATAGMTAAFGTLTNTGTDAVTLVSVESAAAKSVELHEMAMVDGAMVMRELEGGLEISAGSSRELAPGGEHIMLMGLTAPLKAGDEFTITLRFSDDRTLDVVIPVRDFAGAEEEYAPGEGDMDHDTDTDMEHGDDAAQQ